MQSGHAPWLNATDEWERAISDGRSVEVDTRALKFPDARPDMRSPWRASPTGVVSSIDRFAAEHGCRHRGWPGRHVPYWHLSELGRPAKHFEETIDLALPALSETMRAVNDALRDPDGVLRRMAVASAIELGRLLQAADNDNDNDL